MENNFRNQKGGWNNNNQPVTQTPVKEKTPAEEPNNKIINKDRAIGFLGGAGACVLAYGLKRGYSWIIKKFTKANKAKAEVEQAQVDFPPVEEKTPAEPAK